MRARRNRQLSLPCRDRAGAAPEATPREVLLPEAPLPDDLETSLETVGLGPSDQRTELRRLLTARRAAVAEHNARLRWLSGRKRSLEHMLAVLDVDVEARSPPRVHLPKGGPHVHFQIL